MASTPTTTRADRARRAFQLREAGTPWPAILDHFGIRITTTCRRHTKPGPDPAKEARPRP